MSCSPVADTAIDLDSMTNEEQRELLALLEEEEAYRLTHHLYKFTPYARQREFLDTGYDYTERYFIAGNQLEKSLTGGAEVMFHLTGRYPGTEAYYAEGAYEGAWQGRRFNDPLVFWWGRDQRNHHQNDLAHSL